MYIHVCVYVYNVHIAAYAHVGLGEPRRRGVLRTKSWIPKAELEMTPVPRHVPLGVYVSGWCSSQHTYEQVHRSTLNCLRDLCRRLMTTCSSVPFLHSFVFSGFYWCFIKMMTERWKWFHTVTHSKDATKNVHGQDAQEVADFYTERELSLERIAGT